MRIDLQQFGGMIPRVSSRLLPDTCAQKAVNCQFSSGALRPWGDLDEITQVLSSQTILSLYRYNDEWLTWDVDVNVCPTQLASDEWQRIYYTGDGAPKMRDKDGNIYPLGLPAPKNAEDEAKSPVTITVTGTAAKTATVDRITLSEDGVVTVVSLDHNIDPTIEFPIQFSGTGLPILNRFDRIPKVVNEDTFTVEGVSALLEGSIKSISQTSPAVAKCPNHGLLTGDKIKLSSNGMTELQNWEGRIKKKGADKFELVGVDARNFHKFKSGTFHLVSRDFRGRPPRDILSITKGATTTVAMTNNHGYRTGDSVLIVTTGMTELSGWEGTITVTDRTTFTINVDSSTYPDFESGTVQLMARSFDSPPPVPIAKLSHDWWPEVYAKDHGLSDGDVVFFTEVEGMNELNGYEGPVSVQDADSFVLGGVGLFDTIAINWHDFISGEYIVIEKGGITPPPGTTIFDIVKGATTKVQFGSMGIEPFTGLPMFIPGHHDFNTGDVITLGGAIGITELIGWTGEIVVLNDYEIVLTGVDSSAFTWLFTSGWVSLKSRSYAARQPQAIKTIDNADPAKVESIYRHGLTTGDRVVLNVTGMTELDGWEGLVTVLDDKSFILDDVDASAYGSFSSGSFILTAQWDARIDETKAVTHAYSYTFVSKYGEEGPPCLASDPVDLLPGMLAVVTVPGPPADYSNIVTKRLYRTNSGSTDTIWQHVVDLDLTTPTYTDSKRDAELGSIMVSEEWDGPPADLQGLIVLPNGILCGFRKNEICFCEPWQPHAWPLSYRQSTTWDIVAIGAYGMSVLITTTQYPYVITGTQPGQMIMERLEIGEACVSKRGLVDMGYACIYPSPDGLVIAGMNKMEVCTRKVITRSQWQEYCPETLTAFAYQGGYYGFFQKPNGEQGAIIFEPESGVFVELDFWCSAGFSDQTTGQLFLVDGETIYEWDAGEGRPYEWVSKVFVLPRPMNFAVAKVTAEDYPVQFTLYANGEFFVSETVVDEKFFRLPSGIRYDTIEIQLQGSASVNRVQIAGDSEELA